MEQKEKIRMTDHILYWTLLGCFIFGISIISFSLISFYQNSVAPDAPDLGLPSYIGECAGLVKITHNALRENHELYQNVANLDERKRLYGINVLAPIANAFTYSQFCKDPEAIGLMLTADANITLDSAFNGVITFNEAVPLARSYYNEAKALGYFDNHQVQDYLLSQRIARNQFRVTIRAPF